MLGSKSYSDAMHQYTELLLVLHHLIREGKGDTDEADEVRDQMDGPWREMTSHEISITDGLSADLYSIGNESEQVPIQYSEAVSALIKDAAKLANWPYLLEIVRKYQSGINHQELCFLRGWAWQQMEFYEVAQEFLEEMLKCGSVDTLAELMFLRVSMQSKKYETAQKLIAKYDRSTSPALQMAGFQFMSELLDGHGVAKELIAQGELALMCDASTISDGNLQDDLRRTIRINTHIDLAHHYATIANFKSAFKHLENALRLDPDCFPAILMRNALEADASADKTEAKNTMNRIARHYPAAASFPNSFANFSTPHFQNN